MDCYRHPEAPSIATCISCAKPICQECQEEVAGHPMCKPCVADASARLTAPRNPAAIPTAETHVSASELATPPIAAGDSAPVYPSTGNLPTSPADLGTAPGFARRTGRGIFWGFIYGQWWTLLTIFWSFAWGHGGVSVGVGILMVIFYGFFGSVAGLIIGMANLPPGPGTIVGVCTGILVCFIEMALSHDAGSLVNIFFYFFTGRFVGAGITGRVQRPVE